MLYLRIYLINQHKQKNLAASFVLFGQQHNLKWEFCQVGWYFRPNVNFSDFRKLWSEKQTSHGISGAFWFVKLKKRIMFSEGELIFMMMNCLIWSCISYIILIHLCRQFFYYCWIIHTEWRLVKIFWMCVTVNCNIITLVSGHGLSNVSIC